MPKNYWYIARENELLLDCDKGFNRKDAEHIFRIYFREFEVKLSPPEFIIHNSSTPGHKHVQVLLPFDPLDNMRDSWISVILGSDRHREIIARAQYRKRWTNPYLLVSPFLWPQRKPDHVCSHRNWRKCPCLRKIQHPPSEK